jgi:sec-independent protein translocase protein TatC
MRLLSKKPVKPYTGDPDEYRLTLVEHLEELRDRIIRSIAIITVAWGIGWWLFPYFYSFLQSVVDAAIKPTLPKGVEYKEVVLSVTDLFMLQFRLSFTIGLIISFPFLVLQLWGFIAPALHPSERKPFARLAPMSFLLMFIGAGFCWVIIPSALSWFASFCSSFKDIAINQTAGTMITFILKMMLAFGVGFQLPLVVYALGALGLLSAETLIKYWRQAATFIFIAAAILTPSNDAFSMLMMAIPMVILFLLSVYFVKLTQGRKAKQAEMVDDPFASNSGSA